MLLVEGKMLSEIVFWGCRVKDLQLWVESCKKRLEVLAGFRFQTAQRVQKTSVVQKLKIIK